jgi:hypothetical protein
MNRSLATAALRYFTKKPLICVDLDLMRIHSHFTLWASFATFRMQREPHFAFVFAFSNRTNASTDIFPATPTPPINPLHISPVLSTMAPRHDPDGSSSINKDDKSFFDVLPRELRDRIYKYTFDHDFSDEYYRYQFRAPQPHLRLVSRQFMREYDEQTPKNATLFITGRNDRFTCTPAEFPNAPKLPRLAARCTSAEMEQHIGETDAFRQYIDDEEYEVCSSLNARINELYDFIESLQSLQQVKVQFNLNFVKTFDTIYDRMGYYLDPFRYHNGESLLDPNITIELRHLDLNYPNLPASFTSDIPGFDVLKQSATLATFYYSPGCLEKKTKYDAEIKHRGTVEGAVLTAWKSEHECTLVEGARKAASVEAKV